MGIPPLAFAIGMYLPLQINTPLFIGGLISHFVLKSSPDTKVSEARNQRGTLIASGFIAGGALMGVANALLNLVGWNGYVDLGMPDRSDTIAQILSIVFFTALCVYVYWDSKRAKVGD
jgi:hypothetical protein